MKKQSIDWIAALAVGGLCTVGVLSSDAAIVDASAPGGGGTLGGAIFAYTDHQPTGTGQMDPFLTLQNTKGYEVGYNANFPEGPGPYDVQNGGKAHTSARQITASTPFALIGGKNYLVLELDANQQGNRDVAIHQLQVFLSPTAAPTSLTIANNQLVWSGHSAVWSLYSGTVPIPDLEDNYVISSSQSGSGSGDLVAYIPVSNPGSLIGQYITVYSEMGAPPPDYPANDGFEEWGFAAPQFAVPEPTTILAGSLLLLPFGVSMMRSLRRKTA